MSMASAIALGVKVAGLLKSDVYSDWPVEGPRTMLWLSKTFAKSGMSPTQWLEKQLSTARWGDGDRSAHEMRALARIIEVAGCYDQVNVAGLASFELIARRWQVIMEAHAESPP